MNTAGKVAVWMTILGSLLIVALATGILCAAEPIERFGFPQGDVRSNGPIRFAFDSATGNPAWSMEYLTSQIVKKSGADRASLSFKEDFELPKCWRASAQDYAHSGYAKGHLTPAADFGKMADMNATFTYSNAVPQNEPMNSGIWAQLEKGVRADVAEPGVQAWIITLPLYCPDANGILCRPTIGEHHLVVPSHMAKCLLLVTGERYTMLAWCLPNEPPTHGDEFDRHRVTTREVERKARLDFWPKLEAKVQEELETTMP